MINRFFSLTKKIVYVQKQAPKPERSAKPVYQYLYSFYLFNTFSYALKVSRLNLNLNDNELSLAVKAGSRKGQSLRG